MTPQGFISVSNGQTIDREQTNFTSLKISAVGLRGNGLASAESLTLNFDILDENDNQPSIGFTSDSVQMPHQQFYRDTFYDNVKMITILSSDPDLGANGTVSISFSITSPAPSPFYFTSNDNTVRLNGTFPESAPSYGDRYTINVCDNGSPPKCGNYTAIYSKIIYRLYLKLPIGHIFRFVFYVQLKINLNPKAYRC